MAKATKKRTQAKSLSRKQEMSSSDMKKVKGGHNYILGGNYGGTIGTIGQILPGDLAQKVKK